MFQSFSRTNCCNHHSALNVGTWHISVFFQPLGWHVSPFNRLCEDIISNRSILCFLKLHWEPYPHYCSKLNWSDVARVREVGVAWTSLQCNYRKVTEESWEDHLEPWETPDKTYIVINRLFLDWWSSLDPDLSIEIRITWPLWSHVTDDSTALFQHMTQWCRSHLKSALIFHVMAG